MSSLETYLSSVLRLLMVLRRSVLRIDQAYLFEIFCSLIMRNFKYTQSCLQLLRKQMCSLNFLGLYFTSSYFRKSLSPTFPCFHAISLYILIIFLPRTKSTSLSTGFCVCRPRQYDTICWKLDLFSGFFVSYWKIVWADGVNGCGWCLAGRREC